MTARFDWSTQCEGKLRHTSRREARAMRNRTRGGAHLHIYRCPWCATYHLGHQDPYAVDIRNRATVAAEERARLAALAELEELDQ